MILAHTWLLEQITNLFYPNFPLTLDLQEESQKNPMQDIPPSVVS